LEANKRRMRTAMLAWVCKPELYTHASAREHKHISLLIWPNFLWMKKQLD